MHIVKHFFSNLFLFSHVFDDLFHRSRSVIAREAEAGTQIVWGASGSLAAVPKVRAKIVKVPTTFTAGS
jgi:hypothetical protein